MNGAADVGVSLGFGAGPRRFSTRLGGRSSSDDSGAWLVLFLIPAVLLTAGPWAALQSLAGYWGVAATVAGVIFVVASPVLMFFNTPALFVGTSWGLFVFFRLGYWDLAEHLFSWLSSMPDPQAADAPYVDVFAASVLVLLGAALEGLVIVAVPVLTSLLAAVGLHAVLSRAVAGGRRRWAATQRAAVAKPVVDYKAPPPDRSHTSPAPVEAGVILVPASNAVAVSAATDVKVQLRRLSSYAPSYAHRLHRIHEGMLAQGYAPMVPGKRTANLQSSYITYVDPVDGCHLANIISTTLYFVPEQLATELAGHELVNSSGQQPSVHFDTDAKVHFILEIAKRHKRNNARVERPG